MALTATARVLYGSPLKHRQVAIFVILFLAVLIFLSTVSFGVSLGQLTSIDLRILGLALLNSALLSLMPLAILWFLDRREPESLWLYAIALLWGAFIAIGLAAPINRFILANIDQFLVVHPDWQAVLGSDGALLLGAPLAGPIVEETLKGLGVLLLFVLLRSEFDGVRDGFIYGALVGIGFNFYEAASYVLDESQALGNAGWITQLAGRYPLFGLGGHALYTGLFGAFLGLARQTTRRWLAYLAPVIGYGLGFSGHLVNNGMQLMVRLAEVAAGVNPDDLEIPEPTTPLPEPSFFQVWGTGSLSQIFIFLPLLVILGLLLWQSGVWERQVIREGLADESEPVVTTAEYAAIEQDHIFKTRRIPGLDRRTSAAIVRAQNELAIRKWRVKQLGNAPETDSLVNSWREQLAHLRPSMSSPDP